jgi:serine/threonine-protein kinase
MNPRTWALNLAVPLLAAALALAGIAHAQGNQNGYEARPRAGCSTTLTDDAIGYGGSVAVGPGGEVFVGETRAGCVVRFDKAGVGHRVGVDGLQLGRASEVEVAPDGTVYVLDPSNSRLVSIATGGAAAIVLDDQRGFRVTYLRSFTRDAGGRLYVADSDRVLRLDPAGPVAVAGGGGGDVGPGAPATSVRLSGVTDLAAAPDGTLYLAQETLSRVLRVDPQGTITVFAGTGLEGDNGDGGPATKANFAPAGIAADDSGNVYISVQYSHKIRRVDPQGTITTFAGRGTSSSFGRLGDGGPAAQAGFGYPTDLAVHDGSLYIVDEGTTPRIRRIDPAGIITTVVGAH